MSELAPKLRFPEFSGNLTEFKLGEISHIKTGTKDLKDNAVNGKYPFFVRSNKIERINSYSYEGEAILLPGDGVNVGKIYHYINGKFDFHQRVYKISDFEKQTSGKFIYYFLMENFLRHALENSLKASVESLRLPTLKEMPIKCPELLEQEKIASFLSKVDEKIEKLEKKQELWENYKKGMMQQVFSQKLRFNDENGEDYPDWEEKKVSDIAKTIDGDRSNRYPKDKDFVDEGIIFLSTTNIIDNRLSFKERKFISKKKFKELKKGHLKQNDLIVTLRGSIGNIVAFKNEVYKNGFINAQMMIIRLNNNVNPSFFYYWYLTSKTQNNLLKIASGSAQPQLTNSDIKNLQIELPSIVEQTKIANFLSSIDFKIDQLNKELAINRQFKKGLLQQMFCS